MRRIIDRVPGIAPRGTEHHQHAPKHTTILYIALVPLFVSLAMALFVGHYVRFVYETVGFAILLLAATLSDRGMSQERRYHDATYTKAPSLPLKTISMITLGVGLLYDMYWLDDASIIKSIFVGTIGAVGYWMYYGLDPRDDKMPQIEDINPELVLQTIQDAKDKLQTATKETNQIRDRHLRSKLRVAIDHATQIVDAIEYDPRDIRIARRFLIVYLDGLVDIATKYNDVDSRDIDRDLSQKLYRLLDDLQDKFENELEKLRSNDLTDLDITIDALKIQVQH